jgi:hypothetical protein
VLKLAAAHGRTGDRLSDKELSNGDPDVSLTSNTAAHHEVQAIDSESHLRRHTPWPDVLLDKSAPRRCQ